MNSAQVYTTCVSIYAICVVKIWWNFHFSTSYLEKLWIKSVPYRKWTAWKYLEVNLTFIGPCIANVFSEFNQQDATFLKFIYFCKTLYMFQTVFLSIIRSSKLHVQRQIFVRRILLRAASLMARLAARSSTDLTNIWCCMCSFELLMMDGKTIWNTYSVLQK